MRRNLFVWACLLVSAVLIASCGGPAVSPVLPGASATNTPAASGTAAGGAAVGGAAAGGATATVGGAATSVGSGQTVNVTVRDFEFSPKVLTVKIGTTVTWTNQGQAKHTVTSDDGASFNSLLMPGQTFTFKFDKAGTFAYHCMFHGGPGGKGMSGTVIVQ